ncbi:MAG: hypothetical protein AAFY60_15420, partial [Myxococcota bacterium]
MRAGLKLRLFVLALVLSGGGCASSGGSNAVAKQSPTPSEQEGQRFLLPYAPQGGAVCVATQEVVRAVREHSDGLKACMGEYRRFEAKLPMVVAPVGFVHRASFPESFSASQTECAESFVRALEFPVCDMPSEFELDLDWAIKGGEGYPFAPKDGA